MPLTASRTPAMNDGEGSSLLRAALLPLTLTDANCPPPVRKRQRSQAEPPVCRYRRLRCSVCRPRGTQAQQRAALSPKDTGDRVHANLSWSLDMSSTMPITDAARVCRRCRVSPVQFGVLRLMRVVFKQLEPLFRTAKPGAIASWRKTSPKALLEPAVILA